MSAYLGTLGRLVPIYSNPSMKVSGIPARSFQTTLEGRVKAQVRPVGRRAWDLSAAYASPAELALLMAFANGEWGNGPFVWIPPTAPAINMLMPEVSTCGPSAVISTSVSVVGPLTLPDGSVAGRSLYNSTPSSALYFGPTTIPVLPNTKVTASAYLAGDGCKVVVNFYTAAGAYISGASSSTSGVAGVATRLSVTATVPATAASCAIYGSNTTNGARPALTWTDHANEWGVGEGCGKSIVESIGRTALTGHVDLSGRRDSNISFTIQEVG